MAKFGRNDPCPCGSGKKYKKCCADLPKSVMPTREVAPPRVEEVPPDDAGHLDALSNRVVDLVHQKRFEEALAGCHQLLRDYPEVVDGLERSALVHEARGEWALAADFYRRALAFTERPEQRDGFDEQGRAFFRRKIAEAKAQGALT
jgi:tetratricopeptide (TPR) repeat protein